MNAGARRVQRVYLVLLLLHTLAASFIWGINTLFLLDAGLTNTQAFAANAFFTAGLVLFEVPTGVVADMRGRRLSYLLGTLTLAVSTLLYLLMWRLSAPFWAWALASALLGLGFTFFSGAVQAWLVDALKAHGYDGALEPVFARGEIVEGVAMLGGSVLGGYVAQATNLGVPYLLRAAALALSFVTAFLLMHDVGFTPKRDGGAVRQARALLRGAIRYGFANRPVRWVMIASAFTDGVSIYGFYAMQPYLLELYGDPKAYGVAGLSAAIVGGAQIAGGLLVSRVSQRRAAAHDVAAGGHGGERSDPRVDRTRAPLPGRSGIARGVGASLCHRDAGPAGLPQRADSVRAASHRAVVRFVDGIGRWRSRAAAPRPGRRRLGLSGILRLRRRDATAGGAVHLAGPTPAVRSLTAVGRQSSGGGASAWRGWPGLRRGRDADIFTHKDERLCETRPSRSTTRCSRLPTRRGGRFSSDSPVARRASPTWRSRSRSRSTPCRNISVCSSGPA